MRINVPKNLGQNTVPPAIYRVIVTGSKTRNSAAGNLVVAPELTIQNQGPDESVKTIGRKLFGNWTLTEEALSVVNAGYKALTGNDLPAGDFELEELAIRICNDILNKSCLVQVEIRKGQDGVDRNDIKRWTRIEG